MKKILPMIIPMMIAVVLALGLTACSGNTGSDSAAESAAAESGSSSAISSEPDASIPEESEHSSAVPDSKKTQPEGKVLVAVFSATGTTKGVAEKIAEIENADFYEIKAAQEYTTADLDWNDDDSRTTLEQHDKSVRPEIGSDKLSLEGYTKIYIGYPIWWGEEPRIMDTFVESYDFNGITVIPFCTSGSSSIGSSGQNLAKNAGSGNWLNGQRFSGSVSEEELQTWIDSLK